jgi:glycosyltransferase involved in cell wall biosynthesis
MVSISVILPTAREDYSIIGLPNLHIFEPTLESLKNQTFKDFELVIIDGLHHFRPKLFQGRPFHTDKLPFPVKHVPIEHNERFNHRFWMDNKRWNVAGSLNTGIIHAKGELLVLIDDCSEFEKDYLKKFWEGYQSGYFPMAMYIRYLEGNPATLNDRYLKIGYETSKHDEKTLKKLYGEGGLMRDTRYSYVKNAGGSMIAYVNWYYGYSSISLNEALKINGYDELFDGDKGLSDVDFGSRLELAGNKNKFVLDINHQVIEHDHKPVSESLVNIKNRIKCNYAIYLTNRNNNKWRANSGILSGKDIEFIRNESLKPHCDPTPNVYDDNCRGKLFETWTKNQPIFDLKEERKFYI